MLAVLIIGIRFLRFMIPTAILFSGDGSKRLFAVWDTQAVGFPVWGLTFSIW